MLAGSCALVLACGRSAPQPSHEKAPPPPAPSAQKEPAVREPTRLIELPVSAYSTTLAFDEDAAYLLTPDAAYRLVPGAPARRLSIALGFASALTPSSFVYWADGKLLRTPKTGGDAEVLAPIAKSPQIIAASGERFAWLSLDDDGSYVVRTLVNGKPRELYSSRGEMAGLDVVGSSVYFIERPTNDTWRVGAAPLDGGAVRFRAARNGRRPALLTGTDAIYYYDVGALELRRLSLDLADDKSMMSNVVCTPLYAALDVYCASVEGLFVVSTATHAPRILSYGRPGTITGVIADARRVAWTVDVGPNRLAVDQLPIEPEH
jgi:hypothetical protein